MEPVVMIMILFCVCMLCISSSVGGYFGYEHYILIAKEGQAVSCLTDTPLEGGVFRFTDGKINLYPTPAIASSWDKNWGTPKGIACKDIVRGPDMAMKAL